MKWLLGMLLMCALALVACTGPAGQDIDGPSTGMPGTIGPEPGSSPSSPPGGEDFGMADMRFARMMVPHHRQAVEMSNLILAVRDIPPEVAELATQIKLAQGPEITQLVAWSNQWSAELRSSASPPAMDSGAMSSNAMGGMMAHDDLRELASAEGDDAVRLFLEQMILHHEGAIDMAQAEIDNGIHPGAVRMARSIVDSQTSEIERMRDLLSET